MEEVADNSRKDSVQVEYILKNQLNFFFKLYADNRRKDSVQVEYILKNQLNFSFKL